MKKEDAYFISNMSLVILQSMILYSIIFQFIDGNLLFKLTVFCVCLTASFFVAEKYTSVFVNEIVKKIYQNKK